MLSHHKAENSAEDEEEQYNKLSRISCTVFCSKNGLLLSCILPIKLELVYCAKFQTWVHIGPTTQYAAACTSRILRAIHVTENWILKHRKYAGTTR